MRVTGYIFVTTDDQAREDVSLEAQQANIDPYCYLKGR